MKVDKPLSRGTAMKIGGGRIWVDFRYERLPGFCYVCGCLGHSHRECEDYEEDTPESEMPYGSWLKASPNKTRNKGNNQDRESENKLFQELRDNTSAKKKLRLVHDNPLPVLEVLEGTTRTGSADQNDMGNMSVDQQNAKEGGDVQREKW
ncbi:Gag-Pro-Pol polyprotein [Bienertia sinuspersici]